MHLSKSLASLSAQFHLNHSEVFSDSEPDLMLFSLSEGKIEPSEIVQSLQMLGLHISEKQAELILQR
jgi:hypothetical protein